MGVCDCGWVSSSPMCSTPHRHPPTSTCSRVLRGSPHHLLECRHGHPIACSSLGVTPHSMKPPDCFFDVSMRVGHTRAGCVVDGTRVSALCHPHLPLATATHARVNSFFHRIRITPHHIVTTPRSALACFVGEVCMTWDASRVHERSCISDTFPCIGNVLLCTVVPPTPRLRHVGKERRVISLAHEWIFVGGN
jgi:hypothetical protein